MPKIYYLTMTQNILWEIQQWAAHGELYEPVSPPDVTKTFQWHRAQMCALAAENSSDHNVINCFYLAIIGHFVEARDVMRSSTLYGTRPGIRSVMREIIRDRNGLAGYDDLWQDVMS